MVRLSNAEEDEDLKTVSKAWRPHPPPQEASQIWKLPKIKNKNKMTKKEKMAREKVAPKDMCVPEKKKKGTLPDRILEAISRLSDK